MNKIKQTFVARVKSIGTVTGNFWVSKDSNGYHFEPVNNPKDHLYMQMAEWPQFEKECIQEFDRVFNERGLNDAEKSN